MADTSTIPDYLAHMYPPTLVTLTQEQAMPEPDMDSPLSSAPGSPTRSSVGGSYTASSYASPMDSDDVILGAPSMISGNSSNGRNQRLQDTSILSKPFYMQQSVVLKRFDEKKEDDANDGDDDAPDDEMMGNRLNVNKKTLISTTPPDTSSMRLIQARRIVEKAQRMPAVIVDDQGGPSIIPSNHIANPPQIMPRVYRGSGPGRSTIIQTVNSADDMSEPGALPSPYKAFQSLTVETTMIATTEYVLPSTATQSSHVVTPEHHTTTARRKKQQQQSNTKGDQDEPSIDVKTSAIRRRTSQLLARYATKKETPNPTEQVVTPSNASNHRTEAGADSNAKSIVDRHDEPSAAKNTQAAFKALIKPDLQPSDRSLEKKYSRHSRKQKSTESFPIGDTSSSISRNAYFEEQPGDEVRVPRKQYGAPQNVAAPSTANIKAADDDMPEDERHSPKASNEIVGKARQLVFRSKGREDPTPRKSGSGRTDAHPSTEAASKWASAPMHPELGGDDAVKLWNTAHSKKGRSVDEEDLDDSTIGNDSFVSSTAHGRTLSTTNSSIVSGMTATTTNWVEYLSHRGGTMPSSAHKYNTAKSEEVLATPATAKTGTHASRAMRGKEYMDAQPKQDTTPVYRVMTPKKDLLSSEKSAWWLQEEFSRRSIIKKEINTAILSRSHHGDRDSTSPSSRSQNDSADGYDQALPVTVLPPSGQKLQQRPPLSQSSGPAHAVNDVNIFATELSHALRRLPRPSSIVSVEDPEIVAYTKQELDRSRAVSANALGKSDLDKARKSKMAAETARRLTYDAGVEGVEATIVDSERNDTPHEEWERAETPVNAEYLQFHPDGVVSHQYDARNGTSAEDDKEVALRKILVNQKQTATENNDKNYPANSMSKDDSPVPSVDDPLRDADVTAEMKKFASDTRAALRGTIGVELPEKTAHADGQVSSSNTTSTQPSQNPTVFPPGSQSPFRSLAISDSTSFAGGDAGNAPKKPSQPHLCHPQSESLSQLSNNSDIGGQKLMRVPSSATATSVRSVRSAQSKSEELRLRTVPVLIDTMDSDLGIARGDITLSLLNEESIPSEGSEKTAWAGRIQRSIWRCRHMRRNMGGLGGKKENSPPGSPSKRSSLPVDLDKGRVAGGFRSVGSTQDAALQHLKHDDIDEALELYEDIIFAYYSYFENSLKMREKNPSNASAASAVDFKPYIGVALHNLGILNLLNGDYTEALSFFTRAVESRKKCLGEGHPDHVASLVKHAICLYALNEFAGAHGELELALRLAQESAQSLRDRVQIAEILNNLGCLLYMCGQPITARAFFKDSLDIQFQSLGDSLYFESSLLGHSISLGISITRANIGFVKMVTNDLPVAITALEAALSEQQLLLDGPHDSLIATMDHLAVANLLDGKHDRAVSMFGRILQLQYGSYGPHDPRCHVTMEKIKMVQSRGTDFDIALDELRSTFSIPTAQSFPAAVPQDEINSLPNQPLPGSQRPRTRTKNPKTGATHSVATTNSTRSKSTKHGGSNLGLRKVFTSMRKKKIPS